MQIDFGYLETVITKLGPIMERALPIIATALILNWIFKLIKK